MARRRPPLPAGPYLVVGLARSGIAAAEALVGAGERVYGTDSGNPADAGRLAALGVEVSLDGDGIDLLERVNAVVKSPGVPVDAPVIAAARAAGKEVLGELEIGWRLLPNRFVAVTGTNGKTTVTEWLGHVWGEAGEPAEVVGNVGTPVSALAAGSPEGRPEAGTTLICECSSFQLEDSVAFAPDVGVLLNLTPDHLDRHGDLGSYRDAKLRIFARQSAADVAITDLDEPALRDVDLPGEGRRRCYGIEACDGSCAVRVADGAIHDSEGPLIALEEVALGGEHNLRNAMAVAAAALAAGVERTAVAAGLRSFTGVPHRLERLATIGGVTYVNDSKATNPAAAAAALGSFEHGVHAIMGGSLKGGGFEQLRDPVAGSCRAVYLIGEAGERLAADLAATGVELIGCGELRAAVHAAASRAVAGETVLLAPACASFDAFRDYEHRGETFREIVAALRVEGG